MRPVPLVDFPHAGPKYLWVCAARIRGSWAATSPNASGVAPVHCRLSGKPCHVHARGPVVWPMRLQDLVSQNFVLSQFLTMLVGLPRYDASVHWPVARRQRNRPAPSQPLHIFLCHRRGWQLVGAPRHVLEYAVAISSYARRDESGALMASGW